MPTFESFFKFKNHVFELNAINIIELTLIYKKIYLKIIYEEKYLSYLSLKSAFRAIETKIYEN